MLIISKHCYSKLRNAESNELLSLNSVYIYINLIKFNSY